MMVARKVLASNEAMRAKLGEGYEDGIAREGYANMEGDEYAGKRKMCIDFGVTPSELEAGLAGMTLSTWMEMRAEQAGVAYPHGNPRFQQELAAAQGVNAKAHGVPVHVYLVAGDGQVRKSMGRHFGSGMSGEEYLRQGHGRDPMDWSGLDFKDVVGDIPPAGKELAKNTLSEDLLADAPLLALGEVSWSSTFGD